MADSGGRDRQPVLVCTGGRRSGERFFIGARGLMIGRSPECDVVLDDQGVSREHARVLLHNDEVWVQDAGSRNGCFVNGKRLQRHKQLGTGDELRVGAHLFVVELADPFPEHDSVSSFGGPPPPLGAPGALLVERPRTPPPPMEPARSGPHPALVLGLLVSLLALAAVLTWWLGGG